MKKKMKWMCFLCCLFLLSGCIGNFEKKYPNCRVYRVDGACEGFNSLVCSNKKDIYYYDCNGIYVYRSDKSEFLFNVDQPVCSMACTSQYLYYATDNALNRYNIETKIVERVHNVSAVTDLRAHNEDVFVCENSEKGWGMSYLFQNDKEICINDIVNISQESLIKCNGYLIEVFEKKINTIYAEDGWQYYFPDGILVKIGEERIVIDKCKFLFGDTQIDYADIIGEGAATNRTHCSLYEDKLYVLYQYGQGLQYGVYNSLSYLRVKDAIYSVDVKTKDINIVYDTGSNAVQIGGFSVERDEMYLVKQDGVYRCDMQGNHETKIIDGYYDELIFEDCNGYLFIYDASDLFEWKLLLID